MEIEETGAEENLVIRSFVSLRMTNQLPHGNPLACHSERSEESHCSTQDKLIASLDVPYTIGFCVGVFPLALLPFAPLVPQRG